MTSRVPKYEYTCEGQKQEDELSSECSQDGITLEDERTLGDNNETCIREYVSVYLTRGECVSGILNRCGTREQCASKKIGKDAVIYKYCEDKAIFWKLEDNCKTTNPVNMNSNMRLQCQCTLDQVHGEFIMEEQLQTVQIYFNTGSFDRITKSAKTNFVSRLSLIGGTFGLFTGFSILSGIEIIFYIGKIILSVVGEKTPGKRR